MKLFLTLLVAALAAFVGRSLGSERAPAAEVLVDQGAAELLAGIQELGRENERIAAELERRATTLVAAAAPVEELGEAEIGAALARWRAAHPEQADQVATRKSGASRAASGRPEIDSVPIGELVLALSGEGLTNLERQELFQELREGGRIAEYVAAIEKLAAAEPENAELQVALGHAYLQQLFGVGNSPEAGPLAMKSDAAFDRALALDDQNWGARFSKAVSLSNWPAFLGRGPEAIEHFEILLEQQEALPKRAEFAMTYLFLGNMHQAAGDPEEAIATWKAGLALFPEVEGLREALALAQAQEQ